MHTDDPSHHAWREAIVASAQARGVPVISYRQMLEWVDGRNSSTIRGLDWNAGTLTFVTTVGSRCQRAPDDAAHPGADRHPHRAHLRRLPDRLRRPDVKGIQYAMFDSATGICQATYS